MSFWATAKKATAEAIARVKNFIFLLYNEYMVRQIRADKILEILPADKL